MDHKPIKCEHAFCVWRIRGLVGDFEARIHCDVEENDGICNNEKPTNQRKLNIGNQVLNIYILKYFLKILFPNFI